MAAEIKTMSKDELVSEVQKGWNRLASYKGKLAKVADKTDLLVAEVVGGLETTATAVASSYARGYYGNAEGKLVFPKTNQEIDLWAGGVTTLVGMLAMGFGRTAGKHLIDLGAGPVISNASISAFQAGQRDKAKANRKTTA